MQRTAPEKGVCVYLLIIIFFFGGGGRGGHRRLYSEIQERALSFFSKKTHFRKISGTVPRWVRILRLDLRIQS